MEIIKVLILAIIVSILSVLLKQIKPEYSLICVLVGSGILIIYILNAFQNIFGFFMQIVDKTGIDGDMFNTMLKIIGVGYLIEFSSSICIDSGNNSMADKVVLAGKLIIFALSLPIISNLFNLVMELI